MKTYDQANTGAVLRARTLRRESPKPERFLQSQGYRVLRFWNNDIIENMDGVIMTISLSLGRGRGPLGAAGWEGEVGASLDLPPSPSHAAHGPLPLPQGEEIR